MACTVCHQEFHDKGTMSRHRRTVHSDGTAVRWTCEHEGCGKSYSARSALKRHEAVSHEGRTVTCPECSRHFYDNGTLARHRSTAHSGTAARWPCSHDGCDKTFSTKHGAKHHERTAHEGHTFPCPVCRQTFHSKGTMTRHRNTVHKAVRCTVCGRSFESEAKLERHVAEHPDDHDNPNGDRSARRATARDATEPGTFLRHCRVLQQKATHNTTVAAKASICRERLVRTGSAVSSYDGASLLDADAPRCAYFRVFPEWESVLLPLSAFPRNVPADTPCAMLCIDLRVILDELLRGGARMFHVSTCPSQILWWERRIYQTHVVVASDERDCAFFERRADVVELDPKDNQIMFQDSGTV